MSKPVRSISPSPPRPRSVGPGVSNLSLLNPSKQSEIQNETDVSVFERMVKLDSLSASFNVNTYKKNEKLQKIIASSQRFKAAGHILDRKARKERRIARTQALLATKINEYLEVRLKASDMTRQNRYVRLGDEYRLRATLLYDNIDPNTRDGYVS